jgi:hypothetical protein
MPRCIESSTDVARLEETHGHIGGVTATNAFDGDVGEVLQ